MKAAAPGYSGFGEAVKVEAEELERIYSFDEALIRYIDKFDAALDALDQSAHAAMRAWTTAIAELDN